MIDILLSIQKVIQLLMKLSNIFCSWPLKSLIPLSVLKIVNVTVS
jgi:hypothetical protein